MFNNQVLKAIPIIFLIVMLFRIGFAYHDAKKRQYEFAQKEAEVLNSYAMTHRTYYQKLFVNKTLTLSDKTLRALPAFSSSPISKEFSKNNSLNIKIKTVSDRARNKFNQADADELQAIDYFKRNKEKDNFFSDKNKDFYLFAYALRIEPVCLKCHGSKEDAPKFIQEKYNNAYDYKLGEVRGIQSIKIPTKNLEKYFLSHFFQYVLHDFILLIALYLGIRYLLKKSKNINIYLEDEVNKKTLELKNMLTIDRLTKLPNRLKLMEDIDKFRTKQNNHLALINIDSFKEINDFYGHNTGDKLLVEIAKKIKNLCNNKNSHVYKLPSDEYALFTTKNISTEEFYSIIKNIVYYLQETKLNIDENHILITLSCGIASNEEELLNKADIALQSSKKDKVNIIVYNNKFDTKSKIIKNIQSMSILKEAIKKQRIIPYFQPIYNIHNDKIEKYECLARIELENKEVLPPFEFIDIAIKSKLYPEITKAIILKSFEFFEDKEFEFSINLSIHDIQNDKTVSFIKKQLSEYKYANRVVFEILESDKIGNYEQLKEFITSMKKFGCKFAIDDFGSGYSNFANILELKVDYLKIDGSLIKYITTDNNSRVITKTIINFASSLGLQTIAEFVEDKDSLELLKKMGIDFIQGYYVGKPSSELNTDYD
ncbi:EAL domain-containing protein [Sulfurimonas lithotrophica]|nr:EAL domain-containing protein [Sulfurimonas lithotrophica]